MRRSRPFAVVGLALAFALVGCDAAEPPVAPLEPRVITVAGRDWRMALPADAEIRPTGEGVLLDLAPGRRASRRMTLAAPDPETEIDADIEGYARSTAFAGGAELGYDLSVSHVGSGGPETSLTGLWRHGETALAVQCHAQSEPPPPADWCLELLSDLNPSAPQ